MTNFWEIKTCISEYEELVREQGNMSDAWENGSPEAQAENDPGLQFEKDEECASKREELKGLLLALAEEL